MLTRRSKRHGSGLQTAFEETTDFFLLTDLPCAILQGGRGGDEICPARIKTMRLAAPRPRV
eukprot:5798819-Prymnesium_polylepis.1